MVEITKKLVKCHHCGYEFVVPFDTTKVNCKNCGKEIMFFCLKGFAGNSFFR